MAKDGTCKFCNGQGRLVDAHIIPKAFYRKEENHPFVIVNATNSEHPSRSQKGLWDDTMLCCGCEERFAPIDTYAIENLQQRRTEALPIVHNGRILLGRNGGPMALALPWVSGERIAQFALFVLWRAAMSSRKECKGVQLGPFAERIRHALDSGRTSEVDGLYVTLWWERDPKLVGLVFLPYRSSISGVRLWNFWCGGYYFIVQTDSRPNAFPGTPNLLQAAKSTVAIATSLLERKEGMQLVRAVKDGHQKYGDPWKGRWKGAGA